MRVLWTHNFNPKIKESGIFMHLAAENVRKKGIKLDLFYLGNLRRFGDILNAAGNLRRIALKYDLIDSQYGSASGLITSLIGDVPKILTLRGSDWHIYKGYYFPLYVHGVIAKFLTKISMKRYHLIRTMSYRMKNEIKQLNPKLNVVTLPDGIDLNKFKPMNFLKAREILGHKNDFSKWVLFTSISLKNQIKRPYLAIRAVKLANKYMKNQIRLKIAYKVAYNEMPILVNACNLILCTSNHEGWPNSVKEALACNKPFVSTDVSDLKMITEKEKICRICPPNEYFIANNICEVLKNEEPKNLRRYVEDMDINKVSEKLIKIYEELLSTTKN